MQAVEHHDAELVHDSLMEHPANVARYGGVATRLGRTFVQRTTNVRIAEWDGDISSVLSLASDLNE